MNKEIKNKPVVLCIMDGWGLRKNKNNNAIALANTPNYDNFIKNFSSSTLDASGKDVGLPSGQIGNSEVGHINLGCGRIILQSLPKINLGFKNKEIENNKSLNSFIKKHNKNAVVHLMGLCSSGGVHSHKNHLIEMSKILIRNKIKVRLHLFSDGRDTSPKEFGKIINNFVKALPEEIKISSLIGRYFSMDRDQRWERIKKSFDLIVHGKSEYKYNNIHDAIRSGYERGETDEFIKSSLIGNYNGIQKGDSLLMLNFRADRVRQLLLSLLSPSFNNFHRGKEYNSFKNAIGIMEYSEELNKLMDTIYISNPVKDTLGELISRAKLKQLRIAETEKYPHVTFFFNGGIEKKYPNEDRILIPSPKVSTYDMKPEMSAKLIEKKLINVIKKNFYDVIIVNFANPDMVGHTGKLDAVVKSVEIVDEAIGNIKKAIDKTEGLILLTADHGNCELMWDSKKNAPHTAHTTNKVPLILINSKKNKFTKSLKLRNGRLSDIGPTILDFLNINPSKSMTGQSLILKT